MHARSDFKPLMIWVHADAFQPPLAIIDQGKFGTTNGVTLILGSDENPVRVVVPVLPYIRDGVATLPNPFAAFGDVLVATGNGGQAKNLKAGKGSGEKAGR